MSGIMVEHRKQSPTTEKKNALILDRVLDLEKYHSVGMTSITSQDRSACSQFKLKEKGRPKYFQ